MEISNYNYDIIETDEKEYISKRCERALTKDKEYMDLEMNCNDQDIVQENAERICYMQGFKDAIRLCFATQKM